MLTIVKTEGSFSHTNKKSIYQKGQCTYKLLYIIIIPMHTHIWRTMVTHMWQYAIAAEYNNLFAQCSYVWVRESGFVCKNAKILIATYAIESGDLIKKNYSSMKLILLSWTAWNIHFFFRSSFMPRWSENETI